MTSIDAAEIDKFVFNTSVVPSHIFHEFGGFAETLMNENNV